MNRRMWRWSDAWALVILTALLAGLGTNVATAGQAEPSDSVAGVISDVLGELAPDVVPALIGRGIEEVLELASSGVRSLLGLATFDPQAPPTPAALDGLRALGLQVQPLTSLPMAYVSGTIDQILGAVRYGWVQDVYPDRQLQYYRASAPASLESTRATGVEEIHGRGITGAGVGIAIIDSGIDATHPALADHVTHNVKVVGLEQLSVLGVPAPPGAVLGPLVVPFDDLPYNNSDTLSGHGTHCAGIAAADGTGNPELVGMAPDAELIGISAGELIFLSNAVGALDLALTNRDAWNIQVVSNSWGSSFRPFDPGDPINMATKALHDAGVSVVFAAGNDADAMQINPYSVAPWVVSVAAATNSGSLAPFSSGGLGFDNSTVAPLPADGHLSFVGDDVGIYHPDLSAPGVDILSTGTPTGLSLGATASGGALLASGTSMAAPHVAGLLALMRQVNPTLTPDQLVARAIGTTTPMTEDAPLSRAGHGFIDAEAAVRAAEQLGSSPLDDLGPLEQRELEQRPFTTERLDLWSFRALPVTVAGLDTRAVEVEILDDIDAVQVQLQFPSTPLADENIYQYSLRVFDGSGQQIASTVSSSSASGYAELHLDLAAVDPAAAEGWWRIEFAGLLGTWSDLKAIDGNFVNVAVAQVRRRTTAVESSAATTFQATGTRQLYFDGAGAGAAEGALVSEPNVDAMSGARLVGWAPSRLAGATSYLSAALDAEEVVGGLASLSATFVDPLAPIWALALAPKLNVAVTAVAPDGSSLELGNAHFDPLVGALPVTGTYRLPVTTTVLPAGSRLRITMSTSGVYTSALVQLHGGSHGLDGVALTTGQLVNAEGSAGSAP